MIERKQYGYGWILIALIALAPLWAVGMFDRGYWTPDEPREADIAWRMSIQKDRTLPQLAQSAFLEKPPLTYWLSATAMHVFGDTALAARTPNLLYAIVATMAISLLVFSMAGVAAARIAAIVAGSAFTAYQVAIWLAPDACLVAGCAVSLLGLYRGYVAETSREKLLWYTLMHVGALIGFMAKSGPGWIYPGLTLLVLVVWERRWKELALWQLWAGLALQIVGIGTWIYAVWHLPEGSSDLRVLFWNNLAGRFSDLHAVGALNYASGHKNWFGKYFIELPYDLFPWTLLVVAALHRAWISTHLKGAQGTPWRFAIAACLPFLILLSFAATARSIYIAPALLGFSILVGLWSTTLAATPTRYDDLAVRATRYAVSILVVIVVLALCIMAIANLHSLTSRDWVASTVAALVVMAIASLTIRRSNIAQRQRQLYWSLGWAYGAYVATVTVGGVALFPQFDLGQNLSALAQTVHRDINGHALALLQPDETTIAMMDHAILTPVTLIDGEGQSTTQMVTQWFDTHPAGLMLIKLPGHASGPLTQLVNRLRVHKQPGDGLLHTLEQAHAARLVARYELPQGRRYALIEGVSSLAATTIDSPSAGDGVSTIDHLSAHLLDHTD
jgi:4-amino-4-deoxy-L-arabinose transferase-like glycosyltransferase